MGHTSIQLCSTAKFLPNICVHSFSGYCGDVTDRNVTLSFPAFYSIIRFGKLEEHEEKEKKVQSKRELEFLKKVLALMEERPEQRSSSRTW